MKKSLEQPRLIPHSHNILAELETEAFIQDKHNARGIMSMANGGPNTNGSQFFITYAKQPHLYGLYTVFGKVTHGFEVLDLMEKARCIQKDFDACELVSCGSQKSVTLHTNLGDIKCEIACDEVPRAAEHNARGIMSMANSGPNTNGSQFFITYAKQPHLNGLYTVFGKVIHGFEVLDLMEKTQTAPGDRPLAEIRLNRVTIHANPLAG
ncbi:hypothetical protein C3L33_08061, partial [Rhododendron williamsianum]